MHAILFEELECTLRTEAEQEPDWTCANCGFRPSVQFKSKPGNCGNCGSNDWVDVRTQSTDTERGLHGKFEVYKDGDPQDGVFVLKPESDSAARVAVRAYADATDNDALESDLCEWMGGLEECDQDAE
ncbi:hypothetical protein [Natronorubrum sp. DTA7]|uniref:hypothetical protein n=1 Tax=Natronorubrum sp. DTA7 TaxID=3447016 RepID=UPI003F857161